MPLRASLTKKKTISQCHSFFLLCMNHSRHRIRLTLFKKTVGLHLARGLGGGENTVIMRLPVGGYKVGNRLSGNAIQLNMGIGKT